MQIFVQAFSVVLLLLVSTNVGRADEMQYPLSVAAAEKGPVYVADRKLPGIWSIEGGKVSPFYQGSKAFRTPLNAVRCVTLDEQGRVLAGDSSTREVYRFAKAGAKPEALTQGGIGIPMDVVVTKAGDLLVSDLELHRIWKVSAAGGKPTLFGGQCTARTGPGPGREPVGCFGNRGPVAESNARGKSERGCQRPAVQFSSRCGGAG